MPRCSSLGISLKCFRVVKDILSVRVHIQSDTNAVEFFCQINLSIICNGQSLQVDISDLGCSAPRSVSLQTIDILHTSSR